MQRWCLTLGLLILVFAWLGPLPSLAHGSFTAHMALHLLVVAVAAPLLALGLAHGRLDPVRPWPAIFAPLPASGIELLVVWAWHAPLLHAAARQATTWLVAEQLSFLAAGCLLWLAVLGGDDATRMARRAGGVAALLFTSMHMTLLGVLIALSPQPLFAHAPGHASFTGLPPLEDQQLGGVLMLAVGGIVYLIGGLALLAELLAAGSRGGRDCRDASTEEGSTGEAR